MWVDIHPHVHTHTRMHICNVLQISLIIKLYKNRTFHRFSVLSVTMKMLQYDLLNHSWDLCEDIAGHGTIIYQASHVSLWAGAVFKVWSWEWYCWSRTETGLTCDRNDTSCTWQMTLTWKDRALSQLGHWSWLDYYVVLALVSFCLLTNMRRWATLLQAKLGIQRCHRKGGSGDQNP